MNYWVFPIILLVVFIVIASQSDYNNIELILLAVFMVVICGVGINYFFGVNITSTLKNLTTTPQVSTTITNEIPEAASSTSTTSAVDASGAAMGLPQVFHVPGQYDYQNAKALCKAYNGKLATYDEINAAFKRGADWCDYGWSADNMALFPTQKKTWEKYQETDLYKTYCGRPGINGGYNNNLSQPLGANCYAPKPPQSGAIIAPPVPSPVDARVQYWASQLPTLKVSPFNYSDWNEL